MTQFAVTSPNATGFGWLVGGRATVVTGTGVLNEDTHIFSRLAQSFVVPQDHGTLQFTISSADFGSQLTGIPDAFEVALLNADTLTPLAGTVSGLGGTDALLNMQQNGQTFFAPTVTVPGVNSSGLAVNLTQPLTVTVDTSGVPAGTRASLYLDLLGFNSPQNAVAVQNIQFLTDAGGGGGGGNGGGTGSGGGTGGTSGGGSSGGTGSGGGGSQGGGGTTFGGGGSQGGGSGLPGGTGSSGGTGEFGGTTSPTALAIEEVAASHEIPPTFFTVVARPTAPPTEPTAVDYSDVVTMIPPAPTTELPTLPETPTSMARGSVDVDVDEFWPWLIGFPDQPTSGTPTPSKPDKSSKTQPPDKGEDHSSFWPWMEQSTPAATQPDAQQTDTGATEPAEGQEGALPAVDEVFARLTNRNGWYIKAQRTELAEAIAQMLPLPADDKPPEKMTVSLLAAAALCGLTDWIAPDVEPCERRRQDEDDVE